MRQRTPRFVGKLAAHAPYLSQALELDAFMPWEVGVSPMHADVHPWAVSRSAHDAIAGEAGLGNSRFRRDSIVAARSSLGA